MPVLNPESSQRNELPIGNLKSFAGKIHLLNDTYRNTAPSMKDAHRWLKLLVSVLFPLKENPDIGREEIEASLVSLKVRLEQLLEPLERDLPDTPAVVAAKFFEDLPAAYILLGEDAETFTFSDPAAEGIEEVILCYPGFFALVVYRIAHILWQLKVKVLPRILTEYAHGKTGIDIHPGAVIGKNCFIDHGTGIVIGETTVIGDHVKIYQGVTLGALFVNKDLAATKRHPTIGDNVILYAGCAILGGNTIVGDNTIVGGNVWLTESVPPNSIVYRNNLVEVKNGLSERESIHYII